jgi:hypothetical protein
MPLSLRLFASALMLMALACPAPAAAQRYGANPKAKQEEGVPVPPMRGPEPKPEAPQPPPPSPIMSPAPYFEPLPDTTPRIGGLDEQRTGGGRCRTGCAQDYYRCLSGDEMSNCGPARGRCLISCPSVSSSE